MRIACNFESSATKSQTAQLTTLFSSHFYSFFFYFFQYIFQWVGNVHISVFDEWNEDIIVLKLTEIIKLIAHTFVSLHCSKTPRPHNDILRRINTIRVQLKKNLMNSQLIAIHLRVHKLHTDNWMCSITPRIAGMIKQWVVYSFRSRYPTLRKLCALGRFNLNNTNSIKN